MRRNVMERGGGAHIVKSNGWGQKQPICEEQVHKIQMKIRNTNTNENPNLKAMNGDKRS